MAQNCYPVIHIRVTPSEYKKFQSLKEAGYSVRKVFEILLAEKCKESPITVFNKKNGEPLLIPHNILNSKGI